MKHLSEGVVNFFSNQGYIVVATIDGRGRPHCACKGIISIDPKGKIFIFDLYKSNTYLNLSRNDAISITAVDEHKFLGYCLKGRGIIVPAQSIDQKLIKEWDEKIISRLTKRVIKNIHEEKGHPRHPEVFLPKPKYLIAVEVQEIVDLTPQHLKLTHTAVNQGR